MRKIELLIPAVSLSALLAVSSFTSKNENYPYSYNNTTKAYTTFIDEELPDAFEESLQYTLDNSNMVPQGLSISDDYIFVSMYDFYHINNSLVQVYTKDGDLINTCSLRNKAHVGGISYDKERNLLWVSSYLGNVDAYGVFDIVHKDEASPRYKDLYLGQDLRNYNNPFKTAVSYLTMHNNSLYVGNFTLGRNGIVKQYAIDVDEERTIHLKEVNRFKVPNLVQGISFYEKDDNTYMILSRSRGIKVPSTLQIFKYDEEITDYTNPLVNYKSFEFPPMIEQITTDNGSIYSLYESQSEPYKTDKNNGNTLNKTNVKTLLSNFN